MHEKIINFLFALKYKACFKTRVINCSTRFCVARVIKSTDIAPEVDFNEITGSVSSPKKTMQ